MKNKLVLGIDPGATGASVLLKNGKVQDVFRFKGASICDYLNHFGAIFTCMGLQGADMYCYLEKVWGIPGNSSHFAFGENYGIIQTALTANRIAFKTVLPKVWQKKYDPELQNIYKNYQEYNEGKISAAEKKKIRKRFYRDQAFKLYPEERILADTADAYLIAKYGEEND